MNKELRKMELGWEVNRIDSILNILRFMVIFFTVFNLFLIAILIYVNINIKWKIGLSIALMLMSILLFVAQNKCR